MSLARMCLDRQIPIDEIGTYLDSLSHHQKMGELYTLKRKHQAKLFEKAAQARPLELDFFVPAGCAPLTPVIHHGKNSLPAFRYFQKRFCIPESGPPRLFGYNETAIRSLIGPGYFVAYSTREYPTLRERGGVVIDYLRNPDTRVVPGWPVITLTEAGLEGMIYGNTQDYMRRVADGVSIGGAWKKERFMSNYFLLCREEHIQRKALSD